MAATAPELGLEFLPTEISLSIIKQLPDLTSLYNYIHSSPAAARVFDTYAAEIVESHLASGAIHEYTCGIIRLAAYLRAGIRPPGVSTLTDLINLYVHETTEHRYNPPNWTKAPLRLVQQQSGANGNAAAVSASVLRSVLASHHSNEKLMIGCLATYLPRFRALQPLHLADQDFTWESIYHDIEKTEFVGSWQMQPATVPFPKRDIGPPTWCEEQRLLRAAWRVQLFDDLKATTAVGTHFLEQWTDNQIWRLQHNDVAWLLLVDYHGLIEEPEYEPNFITQFIEVETELIYTVLDYMDALKEVANLSAPKPNDVATVQCISSRDWPMPVPSRRDVLEVERYTSAMAFVFQWVHGEMFGHVTEAWCTPLQHVPWDFYRRRGFAIWCEERMLGYGLIGPQFCFGDDDAAVTRDEEGRYGINMLFMAWKSVLVEEELAEVDRINQRFQEKSRLPSPRRERGMVDYCERNITPDIYRMPRAFK